jgi:hypothetical protein
MENSAPIQAVATNLGQGLGNGFQVVPVIALGFIAILSPENGVATLALTGDPAEVLAASERLSAVARGINAEISPLAFGIGAGGIGLASPSIAPVPPGSSSAIFVREHFMANDILNYMVDARRHNAKPGADLVTRLASALSEFRPPKQKVLSPNIVMVAESVVQKVLKGERAWLYGIDIGAKDIVSPNFLLPAVLTVAALRWAPPVVAAGKQGGFLVSLAPDPKGSVLGHTVSSVDIANPVLFFLPIVDVLRRSFKKGECWMDNVVEQYAEYMSGRGHDSDIQDLEVRVVVGGG